MKVFGLLAVLVLGGCFLELAREPAFDPRIPIYAPHGIPDTALGRVGEKERQRYKCVTGLMVCKSFGVSMQCRCTL